MFSNHVFCTSVKCAATIACFTPVVGICREIDKEGKEEGKFFFYPETKFGPTSDLVSAFSIVARGGLNPLMRPPSKEVCDIVNDKTHAIHHCFRALTERDKFHAIYRNAIVSKPDVGSEGRLATNQTKLAACLSTLGFPSVGNFYDGKSCHFQFEQGADIQKMADAYALAWSNLLLDFNHPIYWMKACLQKRDEILAQYNKCEPYYLEKTGDENAYKMVLTPLNVTKEQMEKAKKYL